METRNSKKNKRKLFTGYPRLQRCPAMLVFDRRSLRCVVPPTEDCDIPTTSAPIDGEIPAGQQAPLVWCINHFGNKFFLLFINFVFVSRTMSKYLRFMQRELLAETTKIKKFIFRLTIIESCFCISKSIIFVQFVWVNKFILFSYIPFIQSTLKKMQRAKNYEVCTSEWQHICFGK